MRCYPGCNCPLRLIYIFCSLYSPVIYAGVQCTPLRWKGALFGIQRVYTSLLYILLYKCNVPVCATCVCACMHNWHMQIRTRDLTLSPHLILLYTSFFPFASFLSLVYIRNSCPVLSFWHYTYNNDNRHYALFGQLTAKMVLCSIANVVYVRDRRESVSTFALCCLCIFRLPLFAWSSSSFVYFYTCVIFFRLDTIALHLNYRTILFRAQDVLF